MLSFILIIIANTFYNILILFYVNIIKKENMIQKIII